jgi:hypothetical protein
MIDERSRPYSYAGDDRVNQAITGKSQQNVGLINQSLISPIRLGLTSVCFLMGSGGRVDNLYIAGSVFGKG